MTDITPNVPLLRKTLEHIEAHPEEWNQEYWRCGTTMCFAGTACHLDGGEWVTESAQSTQDLDGLHNGEFVMRRDGEERDQRWGHEAYVHCATRAQRVLGITPGAADKLFDEENTLDDLRRLVGELCGDGHE